MAISTINTTTTIQCDACSHYIDVETTKWAEASYEAKKAGWLNRKIKGDWYNLCCQECYDRVKGD